MSSNLLSATCYACYLRIFKWSSDTDDDTSGTMIRTKNWLFLLLISTQTFAPANWPTNGGTPSNSPTEVTGGKDTTMWGTSSPLEWTLGKPADFSYCNS